MSVNRVLVIGGTGMLGRPAVRRLLQDGFSVRVLARDVERARMLLPESCEVARGDVRDDVRLLDEIADCQAVYLNLAVPMTRNPPAWDVEVEGTRAVVAACQASGVERVIRISAMGVDETASQWWAARAKRDADRALMGSGLNWTIFRPTWFMESLCTMRLAGPFMLCPDLPHSPLRWIAGDDYAQQVVAALRSDGSLRRVYQPQGPEALTIRQALQRFARAWRGGRLRLIPTPPSLLRPGAKFADRPHYFVSLLDMTRDHSARIDREPIPSDLPTPTMKIEDYAQYVERTRDWPRK